MTTGFSRFAVLVGLNVTFWGRWGDVTCVKWEQFGGTRGGFGDLNLVLLRISKCFRRLQNGVDRTVL